MRRLPAILAAAALSLAACGDDNGGSALGRDGGDGDQSAERSGGTPPERTETTRVEVVESIGREGGFDPEGIYERDAPGVVTITAVFDSPGNGVLGGAPGEGGDGQGGQGSGFVIDGRGEIVTNAHVVTTGEGDAIKRADEVYVEFSDGNKVKASIVGEDPNADIALLRIDPEGLTLRPLALGKSTEVQVGEPVAAIGSPFGERQSLSVGVVSAVDRAIESLTDFRISGAVQTDAAINPGNSGGPLVNAAGEVIGVNQSIRSRSGGGEGVGFAVPADTVRRSVDQLREKGEVDYAYLGVSSAPLYPQVVERFDLPVQEGAWLQQVTPGSPGAQAGLEGGGAAVRFQAQEYNPGGDIITRIEGEKVASADDLTDAIARLRPGSEVELEVYRDGERRTVTVKLGERPLDPAGG
jgi:S1-C subfamily serine protease